MTFFSSTDMQTLNTRGSLMPRFLSLIVNNEGTYSAKITKKVINKEETYLSWGNSVNTNYSETEMVVYENVNIIKEVDLAEYASEVSDRIIEIKARKAEEEKKEAPKGIFYSGGGRKHLPAEEDDSLDLYGLESPWVYNTDKKTMIPQEIVDEYTYNDSLFDDEDDAMTKLYNKYYGGK